MDMVGERLIAAPRTEVWAALNDEAILQECIPGCETINRLSESEMTATVKVKIGPMSARFSGKVHLLDIDAPTGYRIEGEGQGGAAGFANGGANVKLEDAEGGTRLTYVVNAQVGGKMAQVGARLIDATAKSLADQFFTRFANKVGAAAPAGKPATGDSEPAEGLMAWFKDFLGSLMGRIRGFFGVRKDPPESAH